MKRIFSGVLLAVLLTSVAYSAFRIGPVWASGAIYIRADGTIDPSTAAITTVDGVTYTFTDNIKESWIVVQRDSIIIDGAGHTLDGVLSSRGIDLAGRTNVVVQNTRIRNCSCAIYLNFSSKNSISGNEITGENIESIYLGNSSNYNSISGNTITDNSEAIFLQLSCNYNIISGNTIGSNTTLNPSGIALHNSSNNVISGNTITAIRASPSIYVVLSSNDNIISENKITNSRDGIYLQASSNNNIISGNTITNSTPNGASGGYGVQVDSSSTNNSIIENTITENLVGIWFSYSTGNRFYHNNIIHNTQQVYSSISYGYPNAWDDGYPSGGNYWSDYAGSDVYSGPYQNETGSDKIGDSQYIINRDNIDRYPLIYPFKYVPTPDFNNDGIIDIFDLVKIALAYGSVPGVPIWNPYVDMNQDSEIDIFDIVVIAINFGKQWPPP